MDDEEVPGLEELVFQPLETYRVGRNEIVAGTETEHCRTLVGEDQERCNAQARDKRDRLKSQTNQAYEESDDRLDAANRDSRAEHRAAKAECEALQGEAARVPRRLVTARLFLDERGRAGLQNALAGARFPSLGRAVEAGIAV